MIQQILTKKILQESSVEEMHHDVARKASDDSGERTLKTKKTLKNDKWGELLSPRKKQQASELDVEGVERRWRQPEHSGGWRGGLGPAFHEDF